MILKNAVFSYKQFAGLAAARTTPEFKNINYNIAYAYFKLKEYDLRDYLKSRLKQ
jgi:hypothetical protein